ncbi:YsnF/AvaK domain-containing protein [Streptomyces mirabilis]|uniref:YsnF/AvaK domain-containing protein n=1 Tax=Streptomyces mirabilis TaxID=68239 RepID=UPI0036D0CA9A
MHATERQEFSRARQRKYVVTEEVQQTVPVRHEEVRVEREPVTEANCEAAAGPDISEAEHEVTLHAERPVVETKAGRSSGSASPPTSAPTRKPSPARSAKIRARPSIPPLS